MQTVQWITFGIAQNLCRTAVHFFPIASGISAPYPVVTRISCFRGGECMKSVSVEGLRLQQPDGVSVDELFPFLKDQPAGLYGLEMTIGCGQPRVDLSRSSCFLEIRNKSASMQFRPQIVRQGKEEKSPSSGLVVKDAYLNSSLVVVNGTEHGIRPGLHGETTGSALFRCDEIPPLTVVEVAASEAVVEKLSAKPFGWGTSRMETVTCAEPLPEGASCYLMYRDAVSQFPLSVRQI